MKKLLLLPLAAMLFFGCSKTEFQSDASMAGKQSTAKAAQEYVQVKFNNHVSSSMANYSYIEYIDEYGELKELRPTSLTSYINVAKSGYVIVNVNIVAVSGYDTINATVSSTNGFYQDVSGPNPATGTATITDVIDSNGDGITITLLADNNG